MPFPSPDLDPSPSLYPGRDYALSIGSGSRARAHLDMLPPVLRDDPSYQAVIYALANEIDRLESAIEGVRAQFNPLTADVLLKAWEVMARVTAEPADVSLDDRRATVLALLRQRAATPTGVSWEQKVSAIVGPGWSYREHVEGDPSSPPAGVIRIVLPYPPSSGSYMFTERVLRQMTRAGKDLQLEFSGGFVTDESQLDQEGLG